MSPPKLLPIRPPTATWLCLAYPAIGELRSVEPNATTPNSQSPNFLVAVRSTFRKSGLQPFKANVPGHGDSCDLPVTWSKCVPQMTFEVRLNWLQVYFRARRGLRDV